jgi:hypothetical protein
MTHPRHLLEGLARRIQIHGEEIALQPAHYTCAYRRRIDVFRVAVNLDFAQREARPLHQPHSAGRQQHEHQQRMQRVGGEIELANVVPHNSDVSPSA